MTEVDIQNSLITMFKTLNDFSGITFLTDSNVAYPNKSFTVPTDARYFVVSFLSNPPSPVANFSEAQNIYTGILQVDIYTPLDSEENESNNKYKWLSKLFSRGKQFDDIMIIRTYKVSSEATEDSYRTIVKVEWEAVIDKE